MDKPVRRQRRLLSTGISGEPWMRAAGDKEPDPVARLEAMGDRVEADA
jgi:hypothetical protein